LPGRLHAGTRYLSIDGAVLTYSSNNYFIYYGHPSASDNTQNLYIAHMTNPWILATGQMIISSPVYTGEQTGAPPPVNESPGMLKYADGRVFLVYAASSCLTDYYIFSMPTLKAGGDSLNASNWAKRPKPVFSKKNHHQYLRSGHNVFLKSKEAPGIGFPATPTAHRDRVLATPPSPRAKLYQECRWYA
jgi:GH43 family beta-xylosidase